MFPGSSNGGLITHLELLSCDNLEDAGAGGWGQVGVVWDALYIDGSMARVLQWSQVPFDRYRPAAGVQEGFCGVFTPQQTQRRNQDGLFAYLQRDRFQALSVYAVVPLCWEDLPRGVLACLAGICPIWGAGGRDASKHSHPLAA